MTASGLESAVDTLCAPMMMDDDELIPYPQSVLQGKLRQEEEKKRKKRVMAAPGTYLPPVMSSDSLFTTVPVTPSSVPTDPVLGSFAAAASSNPAVTKRVLKSGAALVSTSEAMNLNTETVKLESNEVSKFRKTEAEKIAVRDTWIASIVAASGIFFGISAMVWEAFSYVTMAAFSFPIFTGPYMVSQRRLIHKMPTLRHAQNKLRLFVNQLSQENATLSETQNHLTRQTARLAEAELKLQTVCDKNGIQVSELHNLIRRNASILSEMQALEESRIMINLLRAMIASDTSGDFQISSQDELDMLVLRLKALPQVKLSEFKLRQLFAQKDACSISHLLETTQTLMQRDETRPLELQKQATQRQLEQRARRGEVTTPNIV